MCFHSKQTKSATEVQNRFNAKIDNLSNFKPQETINGFDFPLTPVIIDKAPNSITHYNWGLIPEWSKDVEIRKFTLNARIETIEDKPSFSKAINKRCLVIANGFYEWQWLDSKGRHKNKFEIGISDGELFSFAGLYSQWTDIVTGQIIDTYTIITTEANPLMAEIHNIKKRMPVILKREDEKRWLNHSPLSDFSFPYQVDLVARNLNQQTLF